MRWKYQLAAQPAVSPLPGGPPDPGSDGGMVTSSAWFEPANGTHPDLVIFGGGYTLYALDATTGHLFWTIGEPGTLLGVTPDSRSTTFATDLRSGDTLVLYTDGITDVRPPHDLTPQDMQTVVGRAAPPATGAEAVATNIGRLIEQQRAAEAAIAPVKRFF